MDNPYKNFLAGQEDLRDWLDRFFNHLNKSKRPATYFADRAWRPAVDVFETNEEVLVRAELPGVEARDLDLAVDGQILILRGKRETPVPGSSVICHLMEIPFGPFERVVNLPAPVSPEEAKAVYKNGFLDVILPKASPGRQGRVLILEF
ncbi:MAG: Hsp20/alpha crystallin family protein [Candidatus Tectomicrobia bacterium]|uniref:Hsp20/alpha crystallin family protein n=1 Tax=Tectimicrobiota bacterium TaxID=2528274 RepID=A0A932GPD0_UNCTE|nr:Hsp20/alpha crystallin family protein [Candidatus Tectomicrobia bacterium]